MGAAAPVYAAKTNMALDKWQILTGSKLAHIQGAPKISNGNFRQYILLAFVRRVRRIVILLVAIRGQVDTFS
jgi:hypothetical protein